MRLFYDHYTTRIKAELTLVAADMLAMIAAVLYLTPALLGNAPTLDKILLVVWAATPRALAKILSGLERPTESMKILSCATVAVVLVASLLGAGWDLIHSTSPPHYAPTPLALGVLLCAWGAGFLVYQPRAYRLHDFFLGGAFLVGLKTGAPQPYLWIPVFLLAMSLSATIRHLLHDVFHDRRNPPINLQNARTVALLGGGVSALAFLAICLTLGGGRLPQPAPRFDGHPAGYASRFTTVRDARGGASARGAPDDAFSEGVSRQAGVPQPDGERTRRIGLTYRLELRDLSRPQMDTAIVLRIRARRDTAAGREWRPLKTVLWKGISFATYDSATQGWKQPTLTEEAPWPMSLPRPVPRDLASRETLTLVHVVVNPVFENFITPYFTSEISTEGGGGQIVGYARSLPGNDIFPRPGLRPYSSYSARVVLADTDYIPEVHIPGDPSSPGNGEETVDPRYLEVPTATELGFDISDAAEAVFDMGEAGTRSRVEFLRRYFQAGFEYSMDEDWKGGPAPLREFLLDRRRGDCAYFATAAALLLRASGVPTRFVAGFLGGDWEPATGEVVVRNARAHGWIEIYVRGAGWFPLDVTRWVSPSRESVVSIRPALEGEAGAGAADDEGEKELLVGGDLAEPSGTSTGQEDTDPDGFEETDEEPEVASLPPEEAHDSEQSDVVEGLRSFVRGEAPDVIRSESEDDRTSVWEDERRLGDKDPDDWLAGPGAARVRHTVLSKSVRIAVRSVFLLVTIVVVGMLIYVHVRPSRKKKGEDEEGAEDEEPLHLPAAATARFAPVFDRASSRDRVLAAYYRLQLSLEATRNHRRPHQTPIEHAYWLRDKPPGTSASFEHVHRVLYRVLYGGQEVNEDEAHSVERHCQKIRRALG